MPVQVGPPLITIHFDDHVVVCTPDAKMSRPLGQGYFVSDTRFVSGYRLKLGGTAPVLLNSSAVRSFSARFEFTNPPIETVGGALPAGSLHLRLDRTVSHGVHDDYSVVSYAAVPVEVVLEVSVESDFADIFDVKSARFVRRGSLQSEWDERRRHLTTSYRNGDFARALRLQAADSDSPPEFANGGLLFAIRLEPGETWRTCLLWMPALDGGKFRAPSRACHALLGGDVEHDLAAQEWVSRITRFRTSDPGIDEIVRQAVDDLAALRIHRHDRTAAGAGDQPHVDLWVPAAGVPWFVSLFGRDALTVSLQTLALSPNLAIGALGALSALQADAYDDARDMQPGKIEHEVRQGELAFFHLIPHTPYYGTHDATVLFAWTAAEAWRWSGDRATLDRFRPRVEQALRWIDTDGDLDGDGLQEYRTRAPAGGYYNQGWKDSGEAIVGADGTIPELPIALAEHQGYVVAAKRAWAGILDEVYGERAAAARLRDEADRLAAMIEDRFWWESEGTYYLGLDGRKRPIESVASNAGHLLWAGAISEERARRVARRLLADDMWSGWGIRTLSAAHPAYNPFSYQRGSVWPHDNGIIAAGLRRYGLPEEAARVARGIYDAAARFSAGRLPELFAGLERDPGGFPVQYLGANVPQAWAAGAVVHLLATLLGFEPDAPRGSLVVRPALPEWLAEVEVANLRVGEATADLRVRRSADGTQEMDVLECRGVLAVELAR